MSGTDKIATLRAVVRVSLLHHGAAEVRVGRVGEGWGCVAWHGMSEQLLGGQQPPAVTVDWGLPVRRA